MIHLGPRHVGTCAALAMVLALMLRATVACAPNVAASGASTGGSADAGLVADGGEDTDAGNACEDPSPIPVGPQSLRTQVLAALVPDAKGWTVMWARQFYLSGPMDPPNAPGVFVARVGGDAVVQLAPVDPSGYFGRAFGVATAAGTLLCWTTPTGPTCSVVDDQLDVVAGPQQPFGASSLYGLARMGTALYAIVVDGPMVSLIPIDELGNPAAASIPLPCLPVAWSSTHLACRLESGSGCGTQFQTTWCDWLMRVIGLDGVAVGQDVVVAPFGWWQSENELYVAARDDGFLAAWNDDEGYHLQSLTPAGALAGAATTIAPDATATRYDQLVATGDGYAAFGIGSYQSDTSHDLPRVIAMSPAGAPLGPARWVSGPAVGHVIDGLLASSTAGSVSAAWLGDECCNQNYSSQILFRSFRCGAPYGDSDPSAACPPGTPCP